MLALANGYAGRVLRVDLTSGDVWAEELDWGLTADYVGRRGLADKTIFDTVKLGPIP